MRLFPAPNSAGSPALSAETPVPFGPRNRSHCPHAAPPSSITRHTIRMPLLESGREPPLDGRLRGRHVAKGVRIVDLAQHIIRQTDTVDPPAAVQRRSRGRAQLRRMIEVLVVGLKEAEMGYPKLLDASTGVTVRPEQNTILILQEKLPDQKRRTAQILHRRRDLDIGVGILVKERSDPVHIVIEHSDMGVDEAR